MIDSFVFPTCVFSLVVGLLLTNVWFSVRLSGPSPKRRGSKSIGETSSDAKP